MRWALVAAVFLAGPAAAQDVTVARPWARAAVPGGTGAFYCTILGGAAPDRLVSVTTDAAGMAMLHRSSGGDVSTMRAVPALDIPANGTVVLTPGGVHGMLMDARPELKPGATITVTLGFARTAPVTVTAPVVRAGGRAPQP